MTHLCGCGCGQPTRIAPQNHTKKGYIKGQPRRYRQGHSSKFTKNSYKAERYVPEDRGYKTPCWIWKLYRASTDHGHNGNKGTAYRLIYEEKHGPLPAHLILHHLCETPACVNPDHLQPITRTKHVRLHAKLSEEDVRAIRASGSRQVDLAREYGVSPCYINNIIARRAWADVF